MGVKNRWVWAIDECEQSIGVAIFGREGRPSPISNRWAGAIFLWAGGVITFDEGGGGALDCPLIQQIRSNKSMQVYAVPQQIEGSVFWRLCILKALYFVCIASTSLCKSMQHLLQDFKLLMYAAPLAPCVTSNLIQSMHLAMPSVLDIANV